MHHVMRHHVTRHLIVFTLPLFLMFFGVKAPNISRPQKPKPMRRAVLEAPAEKPLQQALVKQCDEPAALMCAIRQAPLPVSLPPSFPVVLPFISFLLLLRLSTPRAPPFPLSYR